MIYSPLRLSRCITREHDGPEVNRVVNGLLRAHDEPRINTELAFVVEQFFGPLPPSPAVILAEANRTGLGTAEHAATVIRVARSANRIRQIGPLVNDHIVIH